VQLSVDGHEYLGTVASLLDSGSMKYTPEDFESSARRISPETSFVYSEVGQNTKRNRWGDRMWGSHSFYVSFAALPFVAIFAAKGFLIFNLALFMGLLIAVYLSLREFNDRVPSLALSLALVFLSSIPSYIFFVNSEMMLMACIAGAVLCGLRFQAIPCAVLLALATAIKPPLVLAFVPLALWHLIHRKDWRAVAVMAAIYVAVGAPQLGYNLYNFGDYQAVDLSPERLEIVEQRRAEGVVGGLNLIERTTRYIDADRFWSFFFSPDIGMLWFFPAMIWCVVRSGRPVWFTAMWLLTALGVVTLSLSSMKLYTLDGGVRYATLVYPLLLFLPGRWRNSTADYAAMGFIAFFGATLLIDATHAIRHPQQVQSKAFPSMAIARTTGTPIYPETFYHSGFRFTRDSVFDFVDNDLYFRANKVQMMVRNAEPGEVIVRMHAPSNYPDATVRGCQYGGECATAWLSAGRVSTLRIPVREEDLINAPYPEYLFHSSRRAATARIQLEFSDMGLRRGRGDLRWQQRFHETPHPFLYPVGPRILAIYPSPNWILQTWASDGLDPEFGNELSTRLRTSASSIFLHRQPDAGLEGAGGLFIENQNTTERSIEITATERAPLDTPLRIYGTVEVAGWSSLTDLEPLPGTDASPPHAVLFIRWFDASGDPMLETPVWTYSEPGNPDFRVERIPVPEHAAAMSMGLRFQNARGVFFLDDLVASWFKDVWDTTRPGVEIR